MTVLTEVYRSKKREGLYLYVPKGLCLDELPEALIKSFGQAELALTLLLNKEKKLARVNVDDVLASLGEKGYFLQMPPTIEGA